LEREGRPDGDAGQGVGAGVAVAVACGLRRLGNTVKLEK
jgi:hypothetical protein